LDITCQNLLFNMDILEHLELILEHTLELTQEHLEHMEHRNTSHHPLQRKTKTRKIKIRKRMERKTDKRN